MDARCLIAWAVVFVPLSPVGVLAEPTVRVARTEPSKADAERLTYNNKMALIGVLREGARQRAVAEGDLQTLCLVLGIGLDVTERYLAQVPGNEALISRRNLMALDLETCRKGLEAGTSSNQSPP
jgi:hypothetical protein